MLLLILVSLFTALILFGVINGEKYMGLCEPLDDGDFPLKQLYSIGFGISMGIPMLRAPRLLGKKIHRYAALLYGDLYAEFYTAAVWAGFLTLSLLLDTVVLIFGVIISESPIIFILISGVLTFAIWTVSAGRLGAEIKKREAECNEEFPNAVSKLALLINSGMVLREAWKLTADNPVGQLYRLMRKAVELMENGASDIEALYKFGVMSNSQEIKKFSAMVIQSIEKGGLNLPEYLLGQSSALLEVKKQTMLRKGEEAAGKLIAPIGIMFAGIMLIIIAAAMQSMVF